MRIKTVTIIGANGTMGKKLSVLFGVLGGSKVYMVSRTIEKSRVARDEILSDMNCGIGEQLIAADFDLLEDCIEDSDLIFESVSESHTIKENVTKIVADAAKRYAQDGREHDTKIFCTGTSGFSVTKLAEYYPDSLRKTYFGVHIFNPPDRMLLCEIVATKYSDRTVLEYLKQYFREVLKRIVIEVKDSAAFLGNRIGFQFIHEAARFADKYQENGGIDYIDGILGTHTGRAMPPLATANYVGLDVYEAIITNIYQNTSDFVREDFIIPQYITDLLGQGRTGRKSGSGLYQTLRGEDGIKRRMVYDIKNTVNREVIRYELPFADEMNRLISGGRYEEAFEYLKREHSFEAELCLEFLLKYIVYSLVEGEEVCSNIHAADDAMAAGFGWCPPLAMLEVLGGKDVFFSIAKERLVGKWKDELEKAAETIEITPSEYDFREYIKAGM